MRIYIKERKKFCVRICMLSLVIVHIIVTLFL